MIIVNNQNVACGCRSCLTVQFIRDLPPLDRPEATRNPIPRTPKQVSLTPPGVAVGVGGCLAKSYPPAFKITQSYPPTSERLSSVPRLIWQATG